jgi:hypothetical protein
VKEIYRALKRDHPDMPAEMKARIAARQGKPGKQHQGPPYKGPIDKTAQGNPMMEGGNVRYTVGPTPEDVAQYIRAQSRGGDIGGAVGMGTGAVGGGALGYHGGKLLEQYLSGAGHPALASGAIPLATAVGALGGAGIGKGIGRRVGESVGGSVAGGPATQIQLPYITGPRTTEAAQELARASAMSGGRYPTVAISPGYRSPMSISPQTEY